MSEAHALPRIETFPDAGLLAAAAAEIVGEALNRRLREGARRVRFVATGGSSPAGCYGRLKDWPLDWSRIDVTLTDDRFVPPEAPDSNEALVRKHLLRGAAAAASFLPLWSQASSPDEAARRVEPAIGALLPFDVVLLGVGDDGHICSLFPHSPELAVGLDPEGKRRVIGVAKAGRPPFVPRISLTLAAILDSGLVVVLTSGPAKKQVLEAALAGHEVPVRAVLAQTRTPVRILWAP